VKKKLRPITNIKVEWEWS